MTTIKTKIEHVVQGQLNGGKFYDVSVHRSPSAAEKTLNRILKYGYPQWRGLDMPFRLIRRVVTVKVESEIMIFSTMPRGKRRTLFDELWIPMWLPKKIRDKIKDIPIPGRESK